MKYILCFILFVSTISFVQADEECDKIKKVIELEIEVRQQKTIAGIKLDESDADFNARMTSMLPDRCQKISDLEEYCAKAREILNLEIRVRNQKRNAGLRLEESSTEFHERITRDFPLECL